MICDANDRPQALAGIMGGGDSEVSDTTTSVLIEAAYFDPMGIARRRSASGCGRSRATASNGGSIPTPSPRAPIGAASCSRQLAGATVAPEPLDVYPRAGRTGATSRSAPTGSNRLLGLELAPDAGPRRARAAGHRGRGRRTRLRRPSRRAGAPTSNARSTSSRRSRGGSASRRIPQTLPNVSGQTGGLTARQRDRRLVADVLVGLGCSEAVSVPLIAAGAAHPARPPARRSRRGGQLAAGRRGGAAPGDPARPARGGRPQRGAGADRRRALRDGPRLPRADATARCCPTSATRSRSSSRARCVRRPAEPDRDRRRLRPRRHRARARRRVSASRRSSSSPPRSPGSRPGGAASLVLDGAVIGGAGEIAADALDTDVPVVALELDLDALLAGARRDRTFRPLSRFPASNIDLAFVLDERVAAAAVARDAARRRRRRSWRTCGCSTSSGPTPSAPVVAASRSRSASGRPTARSPTTRSARSARPRSTRSSPRTAPSCVADAAAPFVHTIRPRYAEVDMQGVVFNAALAHLLRRRRAPGSSRRSATSPNVAFFRDFDVMLVKAVLEWQGPARFDEPVDDRGGARAASARTSLDLRYVATTGGAPACTATITYVSVKPGTHDARADPRRAPRPLEPASRLSLRRRGGASRSGSGQTVNGGPS